MQLRLLDSGRGHGIGSGNGENSGGSDWNEASGTVIQEAGLEWAGEISTPQRQMTTGKGGVIDAVGGTEAVLHEEKRRGKRMLRFRIIQPPEQTNWAFKLCRELLIPSSYNSHLKN